MGKFPIRGLSQQKIEKIYIKVNTNMIARKASEAAKNRVRSIGGGYNGSKAEFDNTVRSYWSKYDIKPEKYWYDLFCSGSDAYDPRFIPDSMWYDSILPYYNYYIMRKAYRDKGMYSRLLPDVKKPETIVKNIAGSFYNGDQDLLITETEAINLCQQEEHLIIKPSVLSGSGKDVTFYDRDDKKSKTIPEIFGKFGTNFVVQRLVQQHLDLAKINPGSLNTIRVVSFYFKGEVHILSTILRMGGVGARVDNISAGGISCVIKPDGWLAEKAVTRKSNWTDEHPSGIKFKDIKVPSYDKIIETVKRLHPTLPYFGIIGWDYAVDECGDPVFIEFNIMPEPNQISCGPTFGELSEDVFKDVFIEKTRKNYFY